MAGQTQPGEAPSLPGVFIRRSSGLTRQVGAWDALVYATITPGFLNPLVFAMWAPSLYPGASMPYATLAVLLFFPIAALYWFLSVSMPRSGGEYIYISRILGPLPGLMSSFTISMVALSWMAFAGTWAVRYCIGATIRGLGILYANSNLISLADVFDNREIQMVVGTVLCISIVFIFLKGAKWVVNVCWAAVAAAGLAVVALAVSVLFGGNDFAANWTSLTGVDYNSIIPAAQNAGLTTQFTVMGTVMAGATYVGLNTLSGTFSANIAGEIRGVQKSQMLALLGSLAIQLVVWFILYQLIYSAFGTEWWISVTQLQATGNAVWPFGAHEPSVFMLLSILTKTPIVPVILALMMIINIFGLSTGQVFGPTRNMFAWAFDRLIPPSLAAIDSRYRSPWKVILICSFLGWVSFVIYLYEPDWMAKAGYSTMAWFVAWIILGIAGIVFPWRRPQLFAASPPLVKSRWLGLPLVTWLGAATLVVSLAIEGFVAWPMFQGLLPWEGIVTAAMFPIAPIFLFYGSRWYWKNHGVNLARQFEEVPPD
jgi:amino acid transporter